MEFYVVVLIFISCMIVLALLIYYCQEKRNPEFSSNEKQRDIASIAFSIGAPELIQNGKSQTPTPIDLHRFYKEKMERQIRVRNNYNNNSIENEKNTTQFVDDPSDSDTSNSEKIYFAPNSTGYSVARRMSESNTSKRIASSVVVGHVAVEDKKLNGSSDCKIIINKEFADNVLLDETSTMLKKPVNVQQINKDVVVVKNQEVNEKRKEDESSVIEITPDSMKEDVPLDEKLLKVPPYNQSYKIKRKNNSSSSLNVVEEEKE